MRWLTRLLRRDRVERELDAELRYDVALRIDPIASLRCE